MADAREPPPLSAPSGSIWGPALNDAGVAFVAAALLLSIFYVFAFRWIHPEFVPFMDREATKLIALGKDLIPVSAGGYRVKGSSAIVEDFNGDEAIVALPRSFQAEDYPFIKVNLQGFTRYSKFKILWRRADDLSKTHALEFNRSGDGATQIAMVYGDENYRGQIADIALLFYDGPALRFENNNGADIVIESIELRPYSVLHVGEQIIADWINPPLWTHSAHNRVEGVHSKGLLRPNAVASMLVLIGFVFTAIRHFFLANKKTTLRATLAPVSLSLCMYAWLFIEVLNWHWRIEAVVGSQERYSQKSLLERAQSNPLRCSRYPENCRTELLPYF